jgi:hypothetical protein
MTVEKLEAMEIDWAQDVGENFQRVKSAALAAIEAANKRADDALNLRRSEYRYIGLDGKMTTAAALEDERDQLRAWLVEVKAENTRLRAALANSDQPCAYCTLPHDEWNKCASGFPGCARADDAIGCPELGASMENNTLRARVAEYETERDTLREAGRYMLRIVDVIRKETKRRSDERYSLMVPETAAILSEDDARAALKGASHEQG